MAKTRYHPELCYEQLISADGDHVTVCHVGDGGVSFHATNVERVTEGWVDGSTKHVVCDYVNEFVTLKDSSVMVFREPKEHVREILRGNDIGYAVYNNRLTMYSTGWRVIISKTFIDEKHETIRSTYIIGSEKMATKQLGDIAVLCKVILDAHA